MHVYAPDAAALMRCANHYGCMRAKVQTIKDRPIARGRREEPGKERGERKHEGTSLCPVRDEWMLIEDLASSC